MKPNLIHCIISNIYILWYNRNRNINQKIIRNIPLYAWYICDIFTMQIHHINRNEVLLNFAIIGITLFKVRKFMVDHNIFLTKKNERIYSAMIGIIIVKNVEMLHYAQDTTHYPCTTLYIIPFVNFFSCISNFVMLIIIGYTLYDQIHHYLTTTLPRFSGHKAVQEIKKYPKFTRSYAYDYYTRT